MRGSEPAPQRSKRRRIVRWVALILLGQGLALLVYDWVERERREARQPFAYERVRGDVLPEVVLERPDGGIVRTQSLRGRPLLLHFWATWCPPCRTELPGLLALEQSGGPLDVIAIALDRDWSDVASYFGGPVPEQVMREPAGILKRAFGVETLPETYLLDHDGITRVRFRGARDWSGSAAAEVLDPFVRPRD